MINVMMMARLASVATLTSALPINMETPAITMILTHGTASNSENTM
jgi:hypothetical protein